MFTKMLILAFYAVMCIAVAANAAPSKVTPNESPPTVPTQERLPIGDVQLVHPHVITIDRFESLLRRAGEIFRPSTFERMPVPSAAPEAQQVAVPYELMQPPTEQPYNYYLPLFDYDEAKLDAKSRKMETISPPPAPSKENLETDYYSVKPKKLPKKFIAGTKQLNVKWLNAFEKQALTDGNGEMPKAVYMMNDERNRINFDDSFFAVDMQVREPDNEPHKEYKDNAERAEEDDFLNEGEEMGEEDLLAAPAAHVPVIRYHNTRQRSLK